MCKSEVHVSCGCLLVVPMLHDNFMKTWRKLPNVHFPSAPTSLNEESRWYETEQSLPEIIIAVSYMTMMLWLLLLVCPKDCIIDCSIEVTVTNDLLRLFNVFIIANDNRLKATKELMTIIVATVNNRLTVCISMVLTEHFRDNRRIALILYIPHVQLNTHCIHFLMSVFGALWEFHDINVWHTSRKLSLSL